MVLVGPRLDVKKIEALGYPDPGLELPVVCPSSNCQVAQKRMTLAQEESLHENWDLVEVL